MTRHLIELAIPTRWGVLRVTRMGWRIQRVWWTRQQGDQLVHRSIIPWGVKLVHQDPAPQCPLHKRPHWRD